MEQIDRNKQLIALYEDKKQREEAARLMALIAREVEALIDERLRKYRAEVVKELYERISKKFRVGGGGAGMSKHGNEFHQPSFLPSDGSGKMTGDFDVDIYKLLTKNFLIKEYGILGLQIRNRADTDYKDLVLASLIPMNTVDCTACRLIVPIFSSGVNLSGKIYFDEATDTLYIYDGLESAWKSVVLT